MRSGSTGGSGSMREFLDVAVGQHHADGFGFFRRRGGGGIVGRHQRAVDDAALRGAGAGAAGKGLQQPRGAAGGGGGKLVVGDIDGPGALADGNAGQRRLIARIEPALRERGGAAPASSQQPAHKPASARSANVAGRGEIMRCVVTEGRSLQLRAIDCSFKPKTSGKQRDRAPYFGANPRQLGAKQPAETTDVGGEYAVYMMAKVAAKRLRKPAFPGFGSPGPKP